MKTTVQLLLALLSLSSAGSEAKAVSPPPDGCYPGLTTAEGCSALFSLTTGQGNTAIGHDALFSDKTGSWNTGVGAVALGFNNGDFNTAVGVASLLLNDTGGNNTAMGAAALLSNNSGSENTAVGALALSSSTDTSGNTAGGFQALEKLLTGSFNSAFGEMALVNLTTGFGNTALGEAALEALTSGDTNTALGPVAGANLQTGSGNVYVGTEVFGVANESNHTYIRNINTTSVSGMTTDTVTVDLFTGLLGHLTSSRRHKEEIKPMANSSEVLYRLKPVTYRYKKEIDRSQALDYGLVAEEVAEIDPNLTACNREGQIESVRYNAINAMLLNEFLKEHRKVEKLEATVANLVTTVKEQAAQIQKMNAQLEVSKPAARVVASEP